MVEYLSFCVKYLKDGSLTVDGEEPTGMTVGTDNTGEAFLI